MSGQEMLYNVAYMRPRQDSDDTDDAFVQCKEEKATRVILAFSNYAKVEFRRPTPESPWPDERDQVVACFHAAFLQGAATAQRVIRQALGIKN